MNKIMLIGRLAKDVDLRYTQSGTAVANFTLAVNRRYNPNGQQEADFINCVAWNKAAEFAAEYFHKGKQMALEGRLQVRSYDGNDGNKRWVSEVVVEQMEFVGSKNDGSKSNSGNGGSGNGYNSGGGADSYAGLGQEVMFDDNDLPF